CLSYAVTLDFLRLLRIKTLREFMERLFFKLLCGVLSTGLILFVAGCGEDPRYSGNTQYLGGGVYGGEQGGGGPPRDTVSYWDGDHTSGPPSIKISLGEQLAYFYKGGVLVGVSQLSTGREGLNTPVGNYKIIQKDKDHASSLFGDYVDASGKVVVPNIDIKKDPKPPGTHFKGTPMPYFMRIVSGTGLHAGYLPGYPASHGCIRMPEFMAEDFFKSVSVGTPVTITN
ncbi:MAG: L,D-transpeptidase family protein, partial [Candidatus Udaeobacter sp.]